MKQEDLKFSQPELTGLIKWEFIQKKKKEEKGREGGRRERRREGGRKDGWKEGHAGYVVRWQSACCLASATSRAPSPDSLDSSTSSTGKRKKANRKDMGIK